MDAFHTDFVSFRSHDFFSGKPEESLPIFFWMCEQRKVFIKGFFLRELSYAMYLYH